MTYQTPTLTTLGPFRDLTQTGGSLNYGDGFSIYCPEFQPPVRS